MKYAQANQGRTFILRLEDGEILHETIEQFAREHDIRAAVLTFLGGADDGSRLVTGPREDRMPPPVEPLHSTLVHAHEVAGVGTIFPNAAGDPILHAHLACGRDGQTVTGCVRAGVRTWHVIEVVLIELTGTSARRLPDQATGFELLIPYT